MEERSTHLTIIVGASTLAEDLRRMLVRKGVAHAGVATHLRGLRKSMVIGQNDLMIVCIALDRPTIKRHGESLRRLLANCDCFPQTVRSVGLLSEVDLTKDIAEMGCDVYAHDTRTAARAVRLLARRWKTHRDRKTAARRARQRSSSEHLTPSAWMWGTEKIPAEFSSFVQIGRGIAAQASDGKSRSRRAKHGRGGNRIPNPPPAFD